MQSNVLPANMAKPVPVLLNAVGWTQPLLIKVNVGPKKVNPDGLLLTVSLKYCPPLARRLTILLNLSPRITKICKKNHTANIGGVFYLNKTPSAFCKRSSNQQNKTFYLHNFIISSISAFNIKSELFCFSI